MWADSKERRPRTAELYLFGPVTCGGCGRGHLGWALYKCYRRSTYTHNTEAGRSNKTSHEVLERMLAAYPDRTPRTVSCLFDDPEHCLEMPELRRQSEPLIHDYVKRIGQMWASATKAGKSRRCGAGGLSRPEAP